MLQGGWFSLLLRTRNVYLHRVMAVQGKFVFPGSLERNRAPPTGKTEAERTEPRSLEAR